MDIHVIKKLEVITDMDEFRLEAGEYATIWTKDGCCMAVQILEIRDSELLVLDEDKDAVVISFKEIADIQQG